MKSIKCPTCSKKVRTDLINDWDVDEMKDVVTAVKTLYKEYFGAMGLCCVGSEKRVRLLHEMKHKVTSCLDEKMRLIDAAHGYGYRADKKKKAKTVK